MSMNEHVAKLSLCSWDMLQTNDGSTKWLFKYSFEEEEILFAVTDMSSIYLEVLSAEKIASKCKQMNRRLEAPVSSVIHHLKQTLLNHHDYMFLSNIILSERLVIVSFSNSFHSGIPFSWRFNCKQDSSSSNPLTKLLLCDPMITAISSLLIENDKLKEVIKQKDREISNYRDNGYKVSRPHLQTNLFDSVVFQKNLRTSREYAVAVTENPFKIVGSRMFNNILSSSFADKISEDIIELSQASSSTIFSNLHASNSPLKDKSPPKKRSKRRKPRPAIRGCVLEANNEDDDLISSGADKFEKEPDKTEKDVSVVSKKPKLQKKARGKLF